MSAKKQALLHTLHSFLRNFAGIYLPNHLKKGTEKQAL
jgi:hypothetical protein